jgi:two-component system, OmpR family, phosphate regulon sensor histidine kinase PhoR
MRKPKPLIWQLIPSYLLIILVSLGGVSWFALTSLRPFFIQRTASDLEIRARILAGQVADHLRPVDAAAVSRICRRVGQRTDTRVTVILADGTVMADSDEEPNRMENHRSRPEVLQALAGGLGRSERYSSTQGQRMMYVALPLEGGDAPFAVLRVAIPLTAVTSQVNALFVDVLIGGFFSAILALALAFLVSRRISRPVEQLRSGAEKFSAGDLQHRLEVPGPAELADLARTMNQMAAQLQGRIDAVISQRNEFETVLASMVEGVVAIDLQGRIMSFNAAFTRMLAVPTGPVKGRDINEIIRDRSFHQLLTESMTQNRLVQGDLVVRQPVERVFDTHCVPLAGLAEAPGGTLVVLHDVTRMRRLENVRQDFVANVSHEIRTPLTAIQGFVETLMQAAEDPEERRRFLDIIQRHVNRLNDILEDLLALARLEQRGEGATVTLETTPLRGVIETAAQLVQWKADARGVRLALDCAADITVKVDATLLEQALINLIDNAVKYSPEKETVHVAAVQADGELQIRVRDHGPGIPQKYQPRIFERFYRVDKARSRKIGGTGLGLAIVKHISQVHGGRVSLESSSGRGSTFTIHLPTPG